MRGYILKENHISLDPLGHIDIMLLLYKDCFNHFCVNAEKIYDKVRKEKVFSVQKLRKSHGSKIKYNNRPR